MSTEFYWIAVAAVTIMSAARLTRLVTYDHFPPVEWLRDKYADATDGSNWQLLAFCAYCASFWVTLFVVGTAYAADVFGDPLLAPANSLGFMAWWVINGTLAASYLAAIVMVNDGEPGDDA